MSLSPIDALRQQYLQDETDPSAHLEAALAPSNSNAGRNVYLAQDAIWSRGEAARLDRSEIEEKPLWGVPISLKDCFDLAGFATSAGSLFYRDQGAADQDSAVAARLRAAGAVITGKTHLHQLAYGITGENADFGDCVQPRDASLLTGGSSSGAAASVQEGSALAAIGTDTGGSIRVPAALCGLAGFRGSIARTHALSAGCTPLAASFDTFGWLYRDLRDGPLLGKALFGLEDVPGAAQETLRIGLPNVEFLYDCDADVAGALGHWQSALVSRGSSVVEFDADFWGEAFGIFAPIQAYEAGRYHRKRAGGFAHFEPAIAERLDWGLKLTEEEIAPLREKHVAFTTYMRELFDRFDFLLLPASPTSRLIAGADQSQTRTRILRYTAPMSVAGLPVVTLPGGMQLVGGPERDAELLALSADLADLAAQLVAKDARLHP